MNQVFKSKTDEAGGHNAHAVILDTDTTDLEQLLKSIHVDAFKPIWGKKPKSTTGDVLSESATIAEGIIQGGKELGKTLLRNVSSKTVSHLLDSRCEYL